MTANIESSDAREIAGFPGYIVTLDGRVMGRRTNCGLREHYRELRPSADAKGYLGLTLCGPNGKRRKVRIHRLVAEVFIPNPDEMPCVRHLDGSRQNNAAKNLAWGTYADNEDDKRQHGTWETRRNGKLTEAARDEAWRLLSAGWQRQKIAKHLCVSPPTISRLLNGRTWV